MNRFSNGVTKRAFDIFQQVKEQGMEIRDPIGTLAAAFYVAAILEGADLTQKDVVERLKVNEQQIRANYPRIREVLKI